MDNNDVDSIKVLHFLLQDMRCCLDLHYIEKILPLPLLETVPGSPDYCAGLMNLKNKCIPVFDLTLGVGLTRDQIYPLSIPILLCSKGTQQIGFIVDKVIGLGEIDKRKIEIPDDLNGNDSPFAGAITIESNISLIINSSWLFGLKLSQQDNQTADHHA